MSNNEKVSSPATTQKRICRNCRLKTLTTDRLKEILTKWSEEERKTVSEENVEISADGILTNHPEIENRAGLSLTGMTVSDALAELNEPDDGQKHVYFYGKK